MRAVFTAKNGVIMKSAYKELKEEALLANKEIPARGLAMYTWGNVSAFDAARGVFAIKPSGVEYDKLQIDDMVVLDLDGKCVEGTLRPSSDTPTHLVLYRAFALEGESKGKVGGITHTHSTFATAWAQAQRSIPIFGTTHADHSPNGVLCAPVLSAEAVAGDYEAETGKAIVEAFKNPPKDFAKCCSLPLKKRGEWMLVPHENPFVLVTGHGPFAWGENAHKSVYNAAVLEEVAKMAFISLSVNPHTNPLASYVVDKHYQRKHGKNAYYGQN